MSQKIFRESALNKLAAPEELDKVIQVTDRRGWIALFGLTLVVVAGLLWSIFGSIPTVLTSTGLLVRQDGIQDIRLPEDGRITEFNLKAGDPVKENQVVGKYRTPNNTDGELRSPVDGVVLEVLAERGMALPGQSSLATIEIPGKPLQGLVFVPLSEGKKIKPGMKVQLAPSSIRAEESGYMLGTVRYVSQFPVSGQSLLLELHSKELVDTLSGTGPLIKVEVELVKDPYTFSGFKWTSESGPKISLSNGTLCTANLILGEQAPISLVLPVLKQEGK